ncbi:MAG: hypothetical protein IIX64_05160 [Bacteroidales bacterium]|nr:hypothetical protein [Bacteroidales bacterium]
MARVEFFAEVPKRNPQESGWTLHFQKVVYYLDNGDVHKGFRFIWRRPNGTLQAARGQARIPSLQELESLVAQAKSAGFFDRELEKTKII